MPLGSVVIAGISPNDGGVGHVKRRLCHVCVRRRRKACAGEG